MEPTAQPMNKISKIYYCHKDALLWPMLIFLRFLFDYVLALCCILLLQPHGIVTAMHFIFMPASLNFQILLLPLNVCQLNVLLVKIFAKKLALIIFSMALQPAIFQITIISPYHYKAQLILCFRLLLAICFQALNNLNHFKKKILLSMEWKQPNNSSSAF